MEKINLTKNTPVEEVLKLSNPCKCESCTVGCRHGSGFLVKEDIPRIAKFMGITEEVLKKDFLEEVEKFNTKKYRKEFRILL